MRRIVWLAFSGLALGLAAGSAGAQLRPESVFQRSLFFEKDIRDRLEAAMPAEQKALVEWGGFHVPSYIFYDDIDEGHAHETQQDLRLWTQIRVDRVHRIYARMRLNYTDFAAGDAHGFRQHDLQGPNLEIGYYELDLSAAAERYGKQKWPCRIVGRGGRQYVEVGRGIALGKILDVGRFDVDTKDFSFMGFAGRTVPGEDNIDPNAPDFSNSRRTFYGSQLSYLGLDRHQPYAFFVLQRDESEETSPVYLQDFRYDSSYYGVGSRGEVVRNLRYEAESLWEFGHSVANGQRGETEPIRAYAFDGELDYYMQRPMKPVLSTEYAYASGDGDRQSATSALLGNTAGTNDNAFQGFGFVNSGLALGARFTNLQFVRLGGRLTPYDRRAAAGRIDVGADYYFLFKTDREGAISDTRATDTSGDVGQEIDLHLEWRILSDLAWTIRYGRFFPGQAYADRDPRDFLYTALNFSF